MATRFCATMASLSTGKSFMTAYYYPKKALISRAEMPPVTTILLPLRRPPLPLHDAYILRDCVLCIFFPPGASKGMERRRSPVVEYLLRWRALRPGNTATGTGGGNEAV